MESNREKVVFRFRRRAGKLCLLVATGSFLCLTLATVCAAFDGSGEDVGMEFQIRKTAHELRVERRLAIIESVIFIVGSAVFVGSAVGYLVLWRCPRCDGSLFLNPQPNYCPHCSCKLDFRNR